jgi:hypothetical protein
MRLIDALIAHVRNDYHQAQSIAGYLKRRLLEKGTWLALGSALVAADKLRPTYAAASIAIALIIALLPTP